MDSSDKGVGATLDIENLEVTYNRVIVAVQGVSMKVPEKAIVALLGTNGAGKSTTVRAISGFLPVDNAEIKKGTIRFPLSEPVPTALIERIAKFLGSVVKFGRRRSRFLLDDPRDRVRASQHVTEPVG